NSGAERFGVGKVKCRPAFGSTAQKTLAVPRRSYSLSRLAILPGAMRIGGRTSACRVTGFSSMQTTGSAELYGFSYTASTSSIFSMYSGLSSATHHIFFPPRLQVVAFEQDPNRFSSYPRYQLALDRLCGDQAHGPAGMSLWRLGT